MNEEWNKFRRKARKEALVEFEENGQSGQVGSGCEFCVFSRNCGVFLIFVYLRTISGIHGHSL